MVPEIDVAELANQRRRDPALRLVVVRPANRFAVETGPAPG